MRGLLADVNVQGHLSYLRQLLDALALWPLLAEYQFAFATFTDLGLARRIADRDLWSFSQQEGWVLFTENRNHDGENSLEATLTESWHSGHLPVLTLANKGRFEHSAEYAQRVACSVAEVLFGIAQGEYRDRPRIYVPN